MNMTKSTRRTYLSSNCNKRKQKDVTEQKWTENKNLIITAPCCFHFYCTNYPLSATIWVGFAFWSLYPANVTNDATSLCDFIYFIYLNLSTSTEWNEKDHDTKQHENTGRMANTGIKPLVFISMVSIGLNFVRLHHIPHWSINIYITKVLKVTIIISHSDVFQSVEVPSRRRYNSAEIFVSFNLLNV